MINDDNNKTMIKLVFDYVINKKQKIILLLKIDVIVLYGLSYELKSNQEESDTKVALHAIQIIQCTPFKVIIQNPSGDTGKMILTLSLIPDQKKVQKDYDSDKRRKGICLKDMYLKEPGGKALIGFHSFILNGYVPTIYIE